MKKMYYVLGLLGIFTPSLASAHVKWFVDSKEVVEAAHGATPFYSWGSSEVIMWSLIVLGVVFVFSLVDKKVHAPKGLLSFGMKHEKVINRIAQAVLGLFLVTVSLIWKIVIVPDVPVVDMLTTVLQVVQVLIGLMYIFNVKPRLASTMLGLLCAWLIFRVGFVEFLENAILLSLAVYFFIINSKEDSKVFLMLNKHAIEIVRIGTGISLIVLAFTEKLLYPELSMQFLQVHHWNFMQPFFPFFTDKLFVLSTGFAEMIFGILFILGYITRITTILIAIFFGVSVTTMLMQFGQWEVEDLVVYGAAILFIFYGHGRTKFFHLMWPSSK